MEVKDVLLGENDEWFSWVSSVHPSVDRWPSFLLRCTPESACTGVALNFPILLPPCCTHLTNFPIKMHIFSGFIDFIVSPTLNVCGDVISLVAGR